MRFLLGLAEACIVPAFLLTLSMFFTYDEQAVLMPIMWAVGNGSPITSGLLSYGVLWIDTQGFSPWRWFFGTSLVFCRVSSDLSFSLSLSFSLFSFFLCLPLSFLFSLLQLLRKKLTRHPPQQSSREA